MGKSSFMSTANWDPNKPKNTIVETPQALCDFLAFQVMVHDALFTVGTGRIVDVGCNRGNLSRRYSERGFECLGIDVEDHAEGFHGEFVQGDFLADSSPNWNPSPMDLVVCNPPFNQGKHKIKGRKLLPEVFLDHMLKLWGPGLRVMLFCPMGFRLNQRRKSARWRKLRDAGVEITSICSLPLDAFEGIQFHAEVLFIGDFHGLPPHMFLTDEALA